jgi:ferrochelatase
MKSPTGIVLLNLGGPADLDAVEPFLTRLFQDPEIFRLPFQATAGRWFARLRASKVRANYAAIGGGSPIRRWTEAQADGLAAQLERRLAADGPFKVYIAFRYAEPLSETALRQMQADGVERAVALTLYPQYSCTTTGSSLNELWRASQRQGLAHAFRWSVIDRWPTHPGFIQAMVDSVRAGLDQYPPTERDDVLLLFSAHSLPLYVVERGDPYPQEIGASVQAVMERLGLSHEYLLAYQSQVGPIQWLGPQTEQVIRQLGRRRRRNVLVVPIAFVSDHIETLSEIDREYGELARTVGIPGFRRAPALNGSPVLQQALADLVCAHLHTGARHTSQYPLRCPGCTNAWCRTILNADGLHAAHSVPAQEAMATKGTD